MRKLIYVALPIASLLLLGFAAPSAAQAPPPFTQKIPPAGPTPGLVAPTTRQPSFDLSAGYETLHVPDATFPFGLNVDGAKNFGAFSLLAEIGWDIRSDNDNALGSDVTNQVWHFGAGPRWTARGKSNVWPFAQVVAGAAYRRTSTDLTNVTASDSNTKFMLQPGAGAVFLVGDGWGIVGQADYRRVFLDEATDGSSGENDFRVFFGIRVVLD